MITAKQDGRVHQVIMFRVLGPLEVTSATGEPVPLTQQVHRAALAALLLHTDQVCLRSWLAAAIWGEHTPVSGASALRTAVYGLRRALGTAGRHIQTCQSGPNPGGYMIRAAEDEVDLRLFRALTADGRTAWYQGDAARAAQALGEALSLWRIGPSDLRPSPALAPDISRLKAEFRYVQDAWMDARLALGQHQEAAPELRQILAHEPLREHVWAQLMLALYRSGDKGGARQAFSEARTTLTTEYGAGPGPELAELHRHVVADSPALGSASWHSTAGHGAAGPAELRAPGCVPLLPFWRARLGGPAEPWRRGPRRHMPGVGGTQDANRDGQLVSYEPRADMRGNLPPSHGHHRRVQVYRQVTMPEARHADVAVVLGCGRAEDFCGAGG